MIQHLLDAGVDFILIETMCSAAEIFAASSEAMERTENWGVSLCLQPNEIGVLLDGNPIAEFFPALTFARFLGINCYPAPLLLPQVKHLRNLMPKEMPLLAYGNVGYADHDGGWVNTDAINPETYSKYAIDWAKAGANIIGGCCGTTPETIFAIKNALK